MSRISPAGGMRYLIGLLGFLLLLGLSAFGANSPVDPIVGRWNWHNHVVLIFHADGTAGLGETGGKGEWKCVSPNQDPRKYVLDWNSGQYVETLYLKKHENRLSGHDQFKARVWGVRIQD